MKKKLLIFALSIGFLASCNGTNNSSSSQSSSILEQYTITWNVDGNISTELYNKGDTPSYKYGTNKDSDEVYSYTFTGWDKEIVPVVEDTTYIAQYSSSYIEYVITWVTASGQTEENYHYGETPSYKGNADKESDAQYTYTFKGWDKPIETVSENTTYTAQYDESLNQYTITFLIDGKEEKVTYYYGETPTYDKTPTKEANEQYHYEFTGWDKEFTSVTDDSVYTAVFKEILNQYTVTWIIGLDSIEEPYSYGETPTFKGDTTREDSAKYHYTFTGWDKPFEEVKGNQTYVAQYDSQIRSYTVNFYEEDGETLLFTKTYQYDEVPSYQGEEPSKEQTNYYTYMFAGWTDGDSVFENELPPVIGETNYYASFNQTAREFDVKINCVNLDGTPIQNPTIVKKKYGETYEIEVPTIDGKTPNRKVIYGIITDNCEEIIYYSGTDVYDGSSISESLTGEGTVESPFEINSGADLAYLKEQVNAGVSFEGQYFVLKKSIDLTAAPNFVIGASTTISFGGILDGNHCSVVGIDITGTTAGTGLFAVLQATASISNLSTYGTVVGRQYTGGIVGRNLGTIFNCYNFADVSHSSSNGCGGITGGNAGTIEKSVNYGTIHTIDTKEKIGGIAGVGESKSKVIDCVNYGLVTGVNIVGGVVGEFQTSANKVSNCTNYGLITGGKRTGGLIGNNQSLIENSTNYGEVKSITSGDVYVGGITGGATSTSTFESCKNVGKVSGIGKYLGGIVGSTGSKSSPTIHACINEGEITSSSNGVGGILGGTLSGTVSVSDCINRGMITGADKVGGIIGALTVGTEENNINEGLVTNNLNSSYDVIIGADER